MTTLLSSISEIQSTLSKDVHDLRMRVKTNSLRIEKCEIEGSNISKKMRRLECKFTTELSRYYIKEEENLPYVFTAPPRNCYFAGRTKEIQELKRILQFEETLNEKKVRVAAVCGLGGIGKTSLVSEYAHQMKDFYKGGVYWFSAEDDKFLEKTVNDVALKIEALLGSFDLTLSNTLKKISSSRDPCLIVLDCLDQLDLSSNIMKFLSFPAQENIFGHFVVLTRRNPNLLVNEASVFEEDSCLQLKCFLSKEAKKFLSSRTGVNLDENVESVAECLCEELGRLPLALEQAGACIKMLRCSLSSYLEQYKTERLRLLNRQSARPVSPGKESSQRLAVHTTWLMNMEYMKKSPDGQAAVLFMNSCSVFNGNEIEEELINVGIPEVEDVAYRKCVSSPLGSRQVLKLLTDFSLFTYVDCVAGCVSTHRLVQELVWENLDSKSKAESFTHAVRMLSYAFSKCSNSEEKNNAEQNISYSPRTPSQFYMWAQFCMHGHRLCKIVEDMLRTLGSVCLDPIWCPATTKIFYECAVHLSANHKHEEAKRTLNFGYRILDWLPLAEYERVKESLSNNSLFPLQIPLSKSFQIEIKRCCMPPFVPLQPLSEKAGPQDSRRNLEEKIEKLKLDGNKSFKEARYEEALDAYSSAIDLGRDCKSAFNVLLLTNRATVYIKLGQYEYALKDANDYITRRPDCWKGYARKALALDGLNEKVSAEIAAALAFYHKSAIFSDFSPFKESFLDLQKRIFKCDSVDDLKHAIYSQDMKTGVLKILVLGSEEYILSLEIFSRPWTNCILVGTRKDCSVCLKPDCTIPLLKCMLANLSFYLDKGQVYCLSGSFVKILNCKFTSYDDEMAAVSTEGDLNVEKSNFANSKAGGLLCVGPGNMVVFDCFFCNNGKAGIEVRKGGALIVKSSRTCGNRLDGLTIGPEASKCVAINCDIDHNDREGIAILDNSTNIMLEGNNVFGNDENGIFMTNSEADISENNFFDNGSWGIWSQSNSRCNISTNRVFRNKAGGVRVGYRAAGKEFSPSVVEQNKLYDNLGPGFVENVNAFEIGESPNTNYDLMKSYFTSPNSLQSAKCQDNEIYNNKNSENIRKLNFSVLFCSNCRMKCEVKSCGKCFTATYCNRSCQENHWSKHKQICKILREKSSYLITSMKSVGLDATQRVEGKKEIDPMFSQYPPRHGMFVVKVHNAVATKFPSYTLVLYDRSHKLFKTFDSRVITELVKELGVLCERKYAEKKLFFHCLFEENGKLRLFTNEFAEFQNW